jgi:ubiquinone/menaquinone biosynthesis C-methylase UbiE
MGISTTNMAQDVSSTQVESLLNEATIHDRWSDSYRNPENRFFYDHAFAHITKLLNAPPRSVMLDAGCGSCSHSVRLAKRGFRVHAVDLSESVLTKARGNVSANQLNQQIVIHRANLRALPFKDSTFHYALCWGVLMHIPDLCHAISELVRVLKPAGTLIISENNMYSLQGMIRFTLKRLSGIGKARIKKTPAGLEYWYEDSDQTFLTRQTNIRWLIRELESNGFLVRAHFAGQFTDFYTAVSSPVVKRLIYGFNNLWFKYIKIPYLAAGNILILQKAN